MSENKSIHSRILIAATPFFVAALLIFGKLIYIQYVEGPDLRAESQSDIIKEKVIKAERGNIYSSDGKLLATTVPVFDLYMDPITVESEVFNREVPHLAKALSEQFDHKTAPAWESYLRQKRSSKKRYVKLAEEVSFADLQTIKSFPIFNLGRFSGGLIYEQENYRTRPLEKIGARTIGYDNERGRTGIEGAYSSFLTGIDGARLKQKVAKEKWKPITGSYTIEPRNGLDVISTIDTKVQDVVHHELLKALERFDADHGCAVVMDVKTGAIKGIANLGRTEEGTYFERRNYAVWESTEPGSTFKLASVLVALEDGLADTNTLVDTEEGIYTIYNKKIKDSNVKNGKGGYGKVSLKRAFEVSSNVGIVKLVYDHYHQRPEDFVDRLYTLGINKPLGVSIKGETAPLIPKPGDANWSGITLPWMAFGYQVSLTPLQILSLYNAVANNGIMVKPRFVEEVREHGRLLKKNEVAVLNPAICSKQTLQKLQSMLNGVVQNGTATNIKNPVVSIAGKTGTCQLNYWKKATRDYQASFAGYFPADNPQYSCIVVINKPNLHRGYYGSTVAAPVFKAIAQNMYGDLPKNLEALTENNFFVEAQQSSGLDDAETNTLPNLVGKDGAEALSWLENQGYKVKVQGIGKVKWQYPQAGSNLGKSALIELRLG